MWLAKLIHIHTLFHLQTKKGLDTFTIGKLELVDVQQSTALSLISSVSFGT